MDFKSKKTSFISFLRVFFLNFKCSDHSKSQKESKEFTKRTVELNKLSEDNENLIPLFYFFKNNEEEIKKSHIDFKSHLLNIISFVKQETNDVKLTEKSLNKIKEKCLPNEYTGFKHNAVQKFFKFLFIKMICCENPYNELNFARMEENNTTSLFKIYGLQLHNKHGGKSLFFLFLTKYRRFKGSYDTNENKICFDTTDDDNITVREAPIELFFINFDDENHFENRFQDLKLKKITEYPNLVIKAYKSIYIYKPIEFIFSGDKKTEILYGCIDKETYKIYNSVGIVKNFNMDEEFHFRIIKYTLVFTEIE